MNCKAPPLISKLWQNWTSKTASGLVSFGRLIWMWLLVPSKSAGVIPDGVRPYWESCVWVSLSSQRVCFSSRVLPGCCRELCHRSSMHWQLRQESLPKCRWSPQTLHGKTGGVCLVLRSQTPSDHARTSRWWRREAVAFAFLLKKYHLCRISLQLFMAPYCELSIGRAESKEHPALSILHFDCWTLVLEESSKTARGPAFYRLVCSQLYCLWGCFGSLRTMNVHTLHFIVKKYVRGFAISDFLPLNSGIRCYSGFNYAGQLNT